MILAKEAFTAGNYELSLKYYSIAIRMHSKKPIAEIFCERANVYLWSQDFEECVKDCNKAISLNPMITMAYYRKGRAY